MNRRVSPLSPSELQNLNGFNILFIRSCSYLLDLLTPASYLKWLMKNYQVCIDLQELRFEAKDTSKQTYLKNLNSLPWPTPNRNIKGPLMNNWEPTKKTQFQFNKSSNIIWVNYINTGISTTSDSNSRRAAQVHNGDFSIGNAVFQVIKTVCIGEQIYLLKPF